MSKETPIADAVFEAANAVFRAKGCAHTTIEDIAKQAHADLRKVKAAWPTTEALVQAILERDIQEASDLFTRIINDRGKADVKLARLVRELMSGYQQSYVVSCAVSEGLENSDSDIRFVKSCLTQPLIDRYRQNTAILGRLIAQGQSEGLFTDADPLEAAYLLRGMMGAAVRYRTVTGKEDDIRDHADFVMRVFLKGLLR
jgi:AcrR family transcriptional regulator